jgi:hypothetical protein
LLNKEGKMSEKKDLSSATKFDMITMPLNSSGTNGNYTITRVPNGWIYTYSLNVS